MTVWPVNKAQATAHVSITADFNIGFYPDQPSVAALFYALGISLTEDGFYRMNQQAGFYGCNFGFLGQFNLLKILYKSTY
jgi:hypothetical protein